MRKVTHGQFINVFDQEMRGNPVANANQEILIMGAIQLYWEHNKNVAYLNNAMKYARARRGIRVNAVRAFLQTFSGAVLKAGKDFVKAGKDVKELPAGFEKLNSWLEWADVKAPEPEYNLAKQQLKVISYLQHQKKEALEHGQREMATMLTDTIVAYAEANKKTAVAS